VRPLIARCQHNAHDEDLVDCAPDAEEVALLVGDRATRGLDLLSLSFLLTDSLKY
jgi:hypothetical protein